MTKKEGRKKF